MLAPVLLAAAAALAGPSPAQGPGAGPGLDVYAPAEPVPRPRVVNLGVAAAAIAVGGPLALVAVDEAGQGGADLNGDGDVLDVVLHVHDARTRLTVGLGLALAPPFDETMQVDGARAAFLVSEAFQGHTDLNGDGDHDDEVVFVHDGVLGVTRNLGVAGNPAFRVEGEHVALDVLEAAQGGGDLNGDGDASDTVVFVYHVPSDTLTSLALAKSSAAPLQLAGGRVAFSVSELAQGARDRNGDGDVLDGVLALHEVATGTTTSLGLAAYEVFGVPLASLDASGLALAVDEGDQGGSDLNGDGDTHDAVVHFHDARLDATINLARAAFDFELQDGVLAMNVLELFQSADLNGDGDMGDAVLATFHVGALHLSSVGLDTGGYVLADGLVAFTVWEGSAGADLNGDGDALDRILHLADAATGQVLGLPAAVTAVALGGGLVAALVDEAAQGGVDRNGDGDALDEVLHVLDVRAFAVRNLRLAGAFDLLAVAPGRVLFAADEPAQGADLDGDGDATDRILFALERPSGVLHRLDLGVSALRLAGDDALVMVDETQEADANADGDQADDVAHALRWGP